MTLVVLTPSRGRPDQLARLARAFRLTVEEPTTLLEVRLDDDDPMLGSYLYPAGVDVHVGPRLGLMPTLNDEADRVLRVIPACDVIGHLGDDHLPVTPRWDQTILEALATPGIAYGNDLLQGERLPTAVFISARIVRALGHFALPAVRHCYGDDYWKALGEAAGCLRYLPDVIFEHLHPFAGKADHDATYAEGGANGELADTDAAAWAAYRDGPRFASDVEAVRSVL